MTTAAFRPRGSVAGSAESKLFTWPSAQLSLLHEQEHAMLERGTFTLLLAHHSRSAHLLVVEASVGDVRWPVGKDCLVTAPPGSAADAASSCCFLFRLYLPSSHEQLTYQLLLFDHDHDPISASPSLALQQISKLQSLLALYASLDLQQPAPTNYPGLVSNPLKELEAAAGEYWVSKVNAKQIEAGQQDGATTYEKHMEAIDCQSSHGSSSTTTATPAGVSKRMMKRMQKARRISAVSKLFSKAVVRGLINAKAHTVHEAAASESKHISSALGDVKQNGIKPAIANVEAVTKVVEAVEGGLPENVRPLTGHGAHDKGGETVFDITALSTWTINESGLRLVVNAAMAANKSMHDVASRDAAIAHLHSVSSSCLTSCVDRNNSGITTAMLAASTGKAVEEMICRAGSKSSSSSHLSSLLQSAGSTDLAANSGSPSASRPPRPRPRRVAFLLNEVSSPVSVNSGNSPIQK